MERLNPVTTPLVRAEFPFRAFPLLADNLGGKKGGNGVSRYLGGKPTLPREKSTGFSHLFSTGWKGWIQVQIALGQTQTFQVIPNLVLPKRSNRD